MNTSITIDEKKDFIRWLLNTHQMKIREAMWVLNYIAGHDQIIQYVHFVDDLENVSRGLILTAHGSDHEPFRFFKGDTETSDPEKVFHEIRLNWDEDLFIQLYFKEAHVSPEYALVREDNPHARLKINAADQKLACSFLEESRTAFSRKMLQEAIDLALDNRSESEFYRLAAIYKHQIEQLKE